MDQKKFTEIQELHNKKNLLEKLYYLIYLLRSYCPWDKEQTLKSLQSSLLEEVYEVIQGIEEKENEKKIQILKEELGDLLFLTHFLIYLCQEKKYFSLEEIYNSTIEKLIQRHPHVFENLTQINTKDVLKNWENFKKKEFGEDTEFLPALLRAHKIQLKASIEGFDWQKDQNNTFLLEIINSIEQELHELKIEIQNKNKNQIELELGDLLFSIVNLARHLEISSEIALHKSIQKFISRFRKVMEIYKKNFKNQNNKTQILEEIYQQVKSKENENPQ